MRIAILTTAFFHDCKEVTHMVDGKQVRGSDKIIYGGAEKYLVDLVRLLQEDNHSVVVYQPFTGIKQPFSKQWRDITFVMIPNNGGWEHNTCTDLNWQFNEYSALSDLRIYMATFLSFPNAISPCITISHGIYWDNTQGVNTIQTLTEEQRKEFFRRQLYGFTAPDAVVAVDSNVRKVLQAMEPGSERKTYVIYNYVDTNKFNPAPKTWDGINVLFPRRLTVLRGSTEVTKAFINLPQYNFTLAGQAHDDKAAQAFFKSHEHRGNVKFIQKEMDEMPEVYKQADISLVPTISTEGLSLSLLESMATGLPVITTPVGGLGDAVIDGYNALIYDPNHDNICDYIQVLAEDKEARLKMGKRNREIAVECFDIEIWKEKWRNILAQFGAVSNVQYHVGYDEAKGCDCQAEAKIDNDYCKIVDITQKKSKPKLVAMMLAHNEADRYLERVIENTLLFCDEIVILDDHSTDETRRILDELMAGKHRGKLMFRGAQNSWENECLLREELLSFTLQVTTPDWLIAIDADELYETNKMNEQLTYLMSQTDVDWIGFRFFDMWDDEQHYRDDENWPAGICHAPRMFKVLPEEFGYEWANKRRHCGSIPVNILRHGEGVNSSVRVKHLGWMKKDDRNNKYLERLQDDPFNEFFPEETYDAILESSPILVKWDDYNPWQTSKLTIAYPPGMEWNIMQQRPHHLLSLAASERNRVFFGDDSASGVYEPIPYLTVVNGETFDCYNSVDILYITSPEQMKRCGNIKYKKLVYDCCDWMNGADFDLICKADIVLFASMLLYKKIPTLIMHTGETGTCCIDYYKKFHNQKMVYLPNACDFEHFSKDSYAGTMLSEKLPAPFLAYMGCIHPTMIDTEIVKALAKKFKLLMIGQNKGMEFKYPNIYETDHISYKDLPQMLSAAQVAIIPFRIDSDYLRYSAPIKVYEYLAAGIPVVASPIPELQPLADMGLIHIVENDDLEGWIKAVEQAMTEYPNVKGQEWAKTQTWDDRWQVLKQEVLSK